MTFNATSFGRTRLDAPTAAALLLALVSSSNAVAAPKVILWDASWLAEARERVQSDDPQLAPAVESLRRDARRALQAGPFSVVNKDMTPPSGDKHDYMSLGPYWWPNPDTPDGLPYVRHDGRRFPGIRKIPNRTDLGDMSSAVETLALAYYFTGDETFAERAKLLIHTWFLDSATRMNPHLKYGQAIRGINEGRGVGIIETRMFAGILDSVGLLADSHAWTKADQRGLVEWFDKYLQWLLESDLGRDERAAENNHGTYFDIQAASFAYFVGNFELATDILRDVGPRRIAVQVEPDGSQRLELNRTNAWSYSIGNLGGLITLARMADKFDVDLWSYQTADGRSLRRAVDFLLPYGVGEREWDYQQIGGFSRESFDPLLRAAAEEYPDGPYRVLLTKLARPEPSSRRNLLARPLVQATGDVEKSPRSAEVVDRINWPEFLARHDLVWSRVPDRWESGAFLGNGLVGAMVYATDDGDALRWRIGRSDVVDRGNRIPIGDFVLRTSGKLTGTDLRLGLWNAELAGEIQTDSGTIDVLSYSHADQLVQIIEVTPTAGEKACHFDWQPGLAVNPRNVYQKMPVPAHERNPEPNRTSNADCELALQPFSSGGGHVTAWREVAGPAGNRIIYLSVGYSPDDLTAPQQDAVDNVNQAVATGRDALLASHRRWWHDFWPRSFLSIPDTRMESFYWIQLYKMASGTRADRPLLDLMGPWFRTTPWPRIWWNLNIQLTYWPQLTANHLKLGESLTRALDTHKRALARNARPFSDDSYAIGRSCSYDLDRAAKPEIGNLPWALHNYYLQYRYSMDDSMLRERLFPLLKGSINYYLHLLREGDDGQLHIPLGLSPEYPNQPDPNPDCNYDLALLRWGCETLLATCDRLEIDDPLIPRWRETLDRLAPYPVDENGYMISASVPFAESHRHYSHLMMIYPLHLVSLEQPENRALVTKSLDHWMGMSKALRGYSFTGAASISALMGRGDAAARYLNQLLDGQRFVIHPNTMYTEAGPVVETPLSGARSIQDMLVTSWGDKIRVFPAVPSAWPDVTIHKLRTEGAFLVSAVRRGGETQFIRIESLAGETCRLVTDMSDPQGAGVAVRRIAANECEIGLQKGESVVLTPKGAAADVTIEPVAAQAGRTNGWGLR